jgi:two-component system LytT family response regulator
VDDEPRGLNALKKMLHKHCPELKITAECADAASAKEKIQLLHPQLVFLDISLPDKTSFDLLQELDSINFEIIFVTAYSQYALRAFQYSAVDYLMKPIDEDLLTSAVKRAEKKIAQGNLNPHINTLLHNLQHSSLSREMKLCIPSTKGFQVVNLRDILYCEASGNYTGFYFANNQNITSAKSISEYEELLADAGFVRIHKSHIINLRHVKEYVRGEGGFIILSNDMKLEVSRRKKEIFIEKMKAFYKFN